jgi:hypothetical protein
MRALCNELAVYLTQAFYRHVFAMTVCDIMILAVDTAEMASAEKHRPAAATAADTRLFPFVKHRLCDPYRTAHLAETEFSFYIIVRPFSRDIAHTRTERTHLHTKSPFGIIVAHFSFL